MRPTPTATTRRHATLTGAPCSTLPRFQLARAVTARSAARRPKCSPYSSAEMRWVLATLRVPSGPFARMQVFRRRPRKRDEAASMRAFTSSSTMKPDLRVGVPWHDTIFDHHVQPLSASTGGRSGNQAAGRAASEHSVVTKYSGNSANSVTSDHAPATTNTSHSVTYAGKPIAAEYAPSNVVYCWPSLTEYQPVTVVPPPEVTYYYLSGW